MYENENEYMDMNIYIRGNIYIYIYINNIKTLTFLVDMLLTWFLLLYILLLTFIL